MKRVLSNANGVKETFHYDAHDDQGYIQTQQDVTGILKANKFQRDANEGYKSEVFNHKARIPTDAIHMWCQAKGIKYGDFMRDPDHLKNFLNDPDNEAWLTRKGKV